MGDKGKAVGVEEDECRRANGTLLPINYSSFHIGTDSAHDSLDQSSTESAQAYVCCTGHCIQYSSYNLRCFV